MSHLDQRKRDYSSTLKTKTTAKTFVILLEHLWEDLIESFIYNEVHPVKISRDILGRGLNSKTHNFKCYMITVDARFEQVNFLWSEKQPLWNQFHKVEVREKNGWYLQLLNGIRIEWR